VEKLLNGYTAKNKPPTLKLQNWFGKDDMIGNAKQELLQLGLQYYSSDNRC
jgi:hypothetical protein